MAMVSVSTIEALSSCKHFVFVPSCCCCFLSKDPGIGYARNRGLKLTSRQVLEVEQHDKRHRMSFAFDSGQFMMCQDESVRL